MNYDIKLDVIGLNCPLPLLRLKQFLPQAKTGQIIQVLASDPAAHLDVGVFIDKSAHEMLHYELKDDLHYFYIKKGSA